MENKHSGKNSVRKINIRKKRNSGKLTFGKLYSGTSYYREKVVRENVIREKKIRENVILKIVFGKVHGNHISTLLQYFLSAPVSLILFLVFYTMSSILSHSEVYATVGGSPQIYSCKRGHLTDFGTHCASRFPPR